MGEWEERYNLGMDPDMGLLLAVVTAVEGICEEGEERRRIGVWITLLIG